MTDLFDKNPRLHYSVPPVVNGRAIEQDSFLIVIPELTENLVWNPSIETNTTGWTAVDATISQSGEQQKYGLFSLKAIPVNMTESGAYYALSLVANTSYTSSVYLYGLPGVTYYIYVTDNAGVLKSEKVTVKGRGFWIRRSVTYTATASATHRIYVTRSAISGVEPFYIDGLQVEAKKYATTYCDGDQTGYVAGQIAYKWLGAPHASVSWRSGDTRAGGREMSFLQFGLVIMMVAGLGMPPVYNVALDSATGGAFYQNSIFGVRDFAIGGALFSRTGSVNDLHELRGQLLDAHRHDRTVFRQPLLLKYRPLNDDGEEMGEDFLIPALYNSGLEGNIDNDYQERIVLQYKQFLPLIIKEGNTAQELTYTNKTDLQTADYLYARENGVWEEFGDGVFPPTDSGGRLWRNPHNGYIYVIVDNGATYDLKYWDGGAWVDVGSFDASASSRDSIYFDNNGDIYIGGSFTTVDGVTVNGIARYNGTTWMSLGAGITAGTEVTAITKLPNGNLVIVGQFTEVDGVAAVAVAQWNGTVWAPMGTINWVDTPFHLAVSPMDGSLYMSGSMYFGTSLAGLVKWNSTLSTWEPVGGWILDAGSSESGGGMAFNKAGELIVVGYFEDGGGIDGADGIVVWDGNQYSKLLNQEQITRVSGDVSFNYVVVMDDGSYTFTVDQNSPKYYLYGVLIPGLVVRYKNGAWYPADWNFDYQWNDPAVALGEQPYYVYITPDDNIYLLNNGSIYMRTYDNVVDWSGDSTTIKFVIYGGTNVYAIVNHTNKKAIYFDGLSIALNEVATLTIDRVTNTVTFQSQSRDLLAYINPVSDMDFGFETGENRISVIHHPYMISYGDDNGALLYSWSYAYDLAGSITTVNTNNGIMYVTLVDDGGDLYHIEMYKDAARGAGDLVAHTASIDVSGGGQILQALIEDNASGIAASVVFDADVISGGDDDIEVHYGYLRSKIYLQWQNGYTSID